MPVTNQDMVKNSTFYRKDAPHRGSEVDGRELDSDNQWNAKQEKTTNKAEIVSGPALTGKSALQAQRHQLEFHHAENATQHNTFGC